jgi:N-hydroxyarylamine O-acetyltransferase
MPFALDEYFERIRYTGSTALTEQTLSDLTLHHICSIPFENVSVLMREPIHLDLDAVFDKLVLRRRGGYCFEQNFLLMEALRHIGFAVTPLSGRVRLGVGRDVLPPRTHLFLRVELQGTPYLLDVGVGGLSVGGVLRFDREGEQPTAFEPRRIVRWSKPSEDHTFLHQYRTGEDWADAVEFTGDVMHPIDRVLANHYTSTHPDSKFINNLLVSLAKKDGTRVNLLNRDFTHRRASTVLERREIGSHPELISTLQQHFGLHLPPGTHLSAPNLIWP